MPHAVGRLEVMRVRRVFPKPDTHASEEPYITLHGTPASATSIVTNALITFVRNGIARPEPVLDLEHARMHLYYPMIERAEVMRIVRSSNERLCYFWRSSDERNAIAWLLAV